MAVSPVIQNAVQVRLVWALGAEVAINVLGAIAAPATVVNQTLANTLGAAIKSTFTSQLAAQMHTSTQLAKVGVRDLRVANQPEFKDSGAGVNGTGTGDPLPKQTALCITLRTGLAGKSFRGRIYFGGYTEAVNDTNGAAAAAAITATLAFCNAMAANFTASGLTNAVLSRPAERSVTVRTTFHNDGTSTADTISQVSAKSGVATGLTAFESRNSRWESQRRRDNARGGGISTLLGTGNIVEIAS